jgi:hypothetical protein
MIEDTMSIAALPPRGSGTRVDTASQSYSWPIRGQIDHRPRESHPLRVWDGGYQREGNGTT